MRILVLSDSHGNVDNMIRAVELEHPDRIFHLGDVMRDADHLAKRFPNIPMDQVPGNCDFASFLPQEQLICIDTFRILLCHGHTYQVKSSLLTAGYKAEEDNLDAFLFGHTHRPLIDRRGKTFFVNPGSIGDYRDPMYAILTIENGKLDARTVHLTF